MLLNQTEQFTDRTDGHDEIHLHRIICPKRILILFAIIVIIFVVVPVVYRINSINIVKKHGGHVRSNIGIMGHILNAVGLESWITPISMSGLIGEIESISISRRNPLPEEFFVVMQHNTSIKYMVIKDGCLRDEDVVNLTLLNNLEYLNISDNPITDNALMQLSSLRQLKLLCIGNTSCTRNGIEQFNSILPGCELTCIK